MTDEVFPKVRVMRDPVRPRWLVSCPLCGGEGSFGIFAALFGAGLKGHALDWRTAQDYAQRHAMAHEATRCGTCLHIPARPIDDVRTKEDA